MNTLIVKLKSKAVEAFCEIWCIKVIWKVYLGTVNNQCYCLGTKYFKSQDALQTCFKIREEISLGGRNSTCLQWTKLTMHFQYFYLFISRSVLNLLTGSMALWL